MECDSEFQELASHNPFIQELDDEKYEVDYLNGYLIIYGVPYLDASGALVYGDLAFPVDKTGWVLDTPKHHQAWFRGNPPHDQNRRKLNIGCVPNPTTISDELKADHAFSLMLIESGQKRAYHSFEEKVRTYIDIIAGPALAAYPGTTPLRGIAAKFAHQQTPLLFSDTFSARYQINDLSFILRGKKVAIIGLGGTGSYILDFIARTHLEQIVLFDDDKTQDHSIFRFPGFIPNAIGENKVDALARQYGNWHSNIVPIAEQINSTNVNRLGEFSFVFVSLDHGPSRLLIVDWLTANDIPFVDCGMGLNRSLVGLNGFVRITGINRDAFEKTKATGHLPTAEPREDEYRRQAQIAELNALNAALAVIRFKQHFGIYDRMDEAVSYVFETASFEMDPLL